ncbi:MAG: hypothetical protein RL095_857 [Verrucomicrobiota bacterium]|jgi:ABC-type sulfate transport system permease subunit
MTPAVKIVIGLGMVFFFGSHGSLIKEWRSGGELNVIFFFVGLGLLVHGGICLFRSRTSEE